MGGPEGALAAADVGADREGTLREEVVSAAARVGPSWKVVSGAGCLKGATPLYSRMALFLPLPSMPGSGKDSPHPTRYSGKCLHRILRIGLKMPLGFWGRHDADP